ncbi:MAG: translation initiation factor IF-3, partial [Bdellovibrionales bacterium]|nr:translation initiation factor IF-3 [Bdellovibrionales bacterium]
SSVKELRIRYRTDSHDLETKVRKARAFLESGDRVKFQMRFRGREVAYKDLGEETFDKIAGMLEDVGAIEQRTKLVGNTMFLVFAPK